MIKRIRKHIWLFIGVMFLAAASIADLKYPAKVPVAGANPSAYAGYVPVNGAAGVEDMGTNGVSWPNPRFQISDGPDTTSEADDTVVDMLTGLEWFRNANPSSGQVNWGAALTYISGMNDGTKINGGYTDWRMPNVNELLSLVSYGFTNTCVPDALGTGNCAAGIVNGGDPFNNLQAQYYWASSSDRGDSFPDDGMTVNFLTGQTSWGDKSINVNYFLAVRGGYGSGNQSGTVSSAVGVNNVASFVSSKQMTASSTYLQNEYGIIPNSRTLIGGKMLNFTATLTTNGGTTPTEFSFTFSGVTASSVGVLELLKLKDSTFRGYQYVAYNNTVTYESGQFYIVNSAGNVPATIVPDETYTVHFFILDNDANYDSLAGNGITDPVGLFILGSGSGGGAGASGDDDWSLQSCELSRGASVIGLLPVVFAFVLLGLLSRKSRSSRK